MRKTTWDMKKKEIGQDTAGADGQKPSEMEDDGLTLITDSFTERREDGSHRSGDRSRSGQKAAKRGQTQPGSSRESRNQEKTRTMNRSDIYADPVKLKARRKKKRKIWFILLEIAVLIGILCFAGYSYISSRLDLMQRLPWTRMRSKTSRFRRRSRSR